MSFSSEWEEAYKNNTNISIWPWSDLVSMFYHIFPKDKSDYNNLNVLELGCGAGANISFFKAIGINYYSIEGSETEVRVLKKKYLEENIHIEQGDFSKGISFDERFDLIFDRAAVAHNETEDIRKIVSNCYQYIKEGGYYIGIDWFATDEKEYTCKTDIDEVVDDRTFKFGGEGTYAYLGNVHFTDEKEIQSIFSEYTPIEITKKSYETTFPYVDTSVHWNFIMKKEI